MMPDDGENVVRFPVRLRRYRFRDEATIPPRPWIVRGLLLRRHVTTMVAQSGVGKSIFGLTMALHLCAGKSFGPFHPVGPCKVAVLSVEEDEDELDRRLHALKRTFDFSADDAARLFIIDCADEPIIAAADRRGTIHVTKIASEMERLMAAQNIDVIIVDPFIEVWSGLENDNGQVKAAAAVIRAITRRLNAACLLMHHVKKGSVTPGDIDAGRGASSLGGLVRIGHTITNMTAEDANNFNLTSFKGIVRIDSSKGNYFPAPEDANWFKFKNVILHNGNPADATQDDQVGVLVPWNPPGLFEGITYEMINDALARIAAGPSDKDRYAFAKNSKKCAGFVIAEVCKIPEERGKRVMDVWQKSGLLYEMEYKDINSRVRNGVAVDISKRPSATADD